MLDGLVKRIVCLANSNKPGGSCVAGKELLANGSVGEWIRPVSGRGSGAVSRHEQQYENGSAPQLLDVIDIPVLDAKPKDHQQENWLLDSRCRWTRIRKANSAELVQMLDPVSPLWIDGYGNMHDRIPVTLACALEDSLRLIKVDSWDIEVSEQGVKGHFRYVMKDYGLRITDPAYKSYKQLREGSHPIGESYLTISLGEPFQSSYTGSWDCYKLIAAVVTEGTPL